MYRFILTALGAAILLGAPLSAAMAACAQRDLAGEWQFYNTWWEDGIGLNWSRCAIEIDKVGNITAITECEDSDNVGDIFDLVAEGEVSITRDCVMTGFVIIDDGGVLEQSNFVHATMNIRKDMIVGVAEDDDVPPSYWTFNMVAK